MLIVLLNNVSKNFKKMFILWYVTVPTPRAKKVSRPHIEPSTMCYLIAKNKKSNE